jgi:hypothetical protein
MSIDTKALQSFQDSAPSWDELQIMLNQQELLEDKEDFNLQQQGRGNTNAQSKLRLFDAPEGYEPEIVLYRDSAGSSYSVQLSNIPL